MRFLSLAEAKPMKLIEVVLLVATLLFPQLAVAEDAEHGRSLAENWCASCHVVSADQRPANARAPSFIMIAKSSDFSSDRLAYLLLDPHPKMAKLALSRRAIDDIAAYILSLKK
jgi:mono/diheme cytochrome c family protein